MPPPMMQLISLPLSPLNEGRIGSREKYCRPELSYQFADEGRQVVPDAVDIFPEEVWRMILSRVDRHEDIFACSEVCKMFQAVLKPRRPEILPSVVLRHVLPIVYSDFVRIGYWKRELLRLRLVSTSWKRFVDNFCQSRTFFEKSGWLGNGFAYKFLHSVQVEQFQKRLLLPRPNSMWCDTPFISRHVKFSDTFFVPLPFHQRPVDQEDEFEGAHRKPARVHKGSRLLQYWNSVMNLLQNCGHHIWYCTFVFGNGILPTDLSPLGAAKLYEDVVMQLVSNMPNLRSLTFIKNSGNMKEDEPILSSVVPAQRLPNLSQLVKLTIGGSQYSAAIARALILAADPGVLEELKVPYELDFDDFPFRSTAITRFTGKVEQPSSFIALQTVKWPLVELDLNVNLNGLSVLIPGITFDSVCTWLNQFEKSMIKLKLTLFFPDAVTNYSLPKETYTHTRLLLPRLKELHLTAGNDEVNSLDFCQELKAIEKLKLETNGDFFDTMSTRMDVIKIRWQTAGMGSSNVWRVLPNLKSFSVEDDWRVCCCTWPKHRCPQAFVLGVKVKSVVLNFQGDV